MIRVQGWGRLDAKYVLIGEAPGEHEEAKGEPFVGVSGYRLGQWWHVAGLKREDFYILNVCEYRPPHNSIDAFDRAYLEQWMTYLHQRIAALTDPWVIIPTGNYALYALTGKGKVKWHQKDGKSPRAGILDWRGSILQYTDLNGRTIKLIPTIHPAATFRQPDYEHICIRDWMKIAHEGTFREINHPARTHHIRPTLEDLDKFVFACERMPTNPVAVDVENPEGPISVVGFSADPMVSLSVDMTEGYWGTDALSKAWALVKRFCEGPVEKILHYGLSDSYKLAQVGIHIKNYLYDTLYMHHCLDPSDFHSLDYCASRDTRTPFWKSMAKDADESSRFSSNWSAFLTYNGLDCCVTRELYNVYKQRLRDCGKWEFYLQHYAGLLEPLHYLQLRGIRVDNRQRCYRLAHLVADCVEIQDQLEAATGLKLYGKTSLSNHKLKHYLYEVLGLPKQERQRKARGEKTVSSDEVAVRRLMLKYPTVLKETGPLILTHKRKSKLTEFYQESRLDPDGRYRSSYSMNTEAGRLASQKTPLGTGGNGQNTDRETRDVFLADEGMIGINVDLSQAEARVDYLLIYRLTDDKSMYDKAMTRPDEYDQHTENASYIFNVPSDDVTKEQRYLGKKAVHGAFRDMQGQKLSDELLKDGYVYTGTECQRMIDAFKRRVPGIEDLFRWVRRRMLTDGYLENSWGRRLTFFKERALNQYDHDAYRRGYSFDPQSEVADLMNQLGFKPFFWYLEETSKRAGKRVGWINVHDHDALFFSMLPDYAYAATSWLVGSLETSHTLHGTALSVPCEMAIGRSRKSEVGWKRLPSREAFEEAIQSCSTSRPSPNEP